MSTGNRLFKVLMSDEVNGQRFSFSMEYLAANSIAARVQAYREFENCQVESVDLVLYKGNEIRTALDKAIYDLGKSCDRIKREQQCLA